MDRLVDLANTNEGFVALILGSIGVLVTLIGFLIPKSATNKITQRQRSGKNSTNIQIGQINEKEDD